MTERPNARRVLLVAGDLDFREPTAYALNLVRGLKERQIPSKVVALGGIFAEAFAREGIPVEIQPFLGSFIIDPFLFRELTRTLAEDAFDVVHAIDWPRIPLAVKLAKKLGLPVVATIHFTYSRQGPLNMDPAWVRRIITFTEAHREDLVNRHKVKKDIVRVVPFGVNLVLIRRALDEQKARSTTPVVGFVGGLRLDSGLSFLIYAVKTICEKGRPIHLFIVGSGPEITALRHLVVDLALQDAVTFVSSPIETYQLLPSFHIFCSPSIEGGVKQSLLDAMACGKPVVAAGVGGTFEIVQDGVTGIIVPPRDARALADAIIAILDDPARAEEMGRNARQHVEERFALPRMVDLTESVYGQAMEVFAEARG